MPIRLDRSASPLASATVAGRQTALEAALRENERLREELDQSRRHRDRLEDQLRAARALEAVGKTAVGVAHDFNNVLASISGASELLLRRLGPNQGELRSSVDRIRKAAVWGASLVRPLLAAGGAPVPVTLDLNEVLSGAEPILRLLVGEDHELAIRRRAPGPCDVHMDVGQLHQVITNLVANARDALGPGGSIEIAADRVELDEDRAGRRGLVRGGRYTVLTVRDTGCGMDPATRDRIFERHFTTKEPGKGNGLGLATVYEAVTRAGGAILVASDAGRGSTFEVYLPAPEPLPAEAQPMADSGPTSGTETVLVVEDERPVRELIRDVLRLQGYTVLEAKDGQEALGRASSHAGPIHLVVLDAVLPGVTAGELVIQLEASRPGVRALYISGYTGDAVRQHGLQVGANFLQKPFTVDALARKVRDMLDAS